MRSRHCTYESEGPTRTVNGVSLRLQGRAYTSPADRWLAFEMVAPQIEDPQLAHASQLFEDFA